jgi:hypothetical protein
MFTRHVTMKLRANSAAEFTRIIENEIIPRDCASDLDYS